MNINVLQFDLAWRQPEKNFETAAGLLKQAAPAPGGLIVLPEIFATGFSTDASVTAPAGEPTLEFLKDIAWQYSCFVIGGGVYEGKNVAFCVDDEGELVVTYAKRRLYSPLGEDRAYAAGDKPAIFEIGGVKVSPMVCYDIRFPEFFREAVALGAEVFVVIASWPAGRREHWRTLLTARAIENQAWVVGANCTGKDPNVEHSGDSMVVDPKGNIIVDFQGNCGVMQAKIDMETLRQWRKDFPALKDAGLL